MGDLTRFHLGDGLFFAVRPVAVKTTQAVTKDNAVEANGG